jgi:16S rRNA (guanine527-N7)-methyltransferase
LTGSTVFQSRHDHAGPGRACIPATPPPAVSHETSVHANTDIGPALDGLGERYALSQGQLDQLAQILRMLADDALAPTSVREPLRAVEVHLADSLAALELQVVREAAQIADIGAGAGFPGLPLAVALPHSEVKLVESQGRKSAFIERAVAGARIENAEAVRARVEEWPEGIGAQDVVLARAVAPQPIVLEYAAPLLRLGGVLVDWRGRRDPEDERVAIEVAELLGMKHDSTLRAEPYEGARDHHFHVYLKVGETPDRFPRRVGMARKKPLAS